MPTPPVPYRQVKMNIVIVDLNAPEVRFKMTPYTPGLPGTPQEPPPGGVCTAGPSFRGRLARRWKSRAPDARIPRGRPRPGRDQQPLLRPVSHREHAARSGPVRLRVRDRPRRVARGRLLRVRVPRIQNYAIMADSPAVNIDPANFASIVHRDPAFPDGKHVLEPVTLWNALSGSGQIITNGVKTIPCYLPCAPNSPPRAASLPATPPYVERQLLVQPHQRALRHRDQPGRPDAVPVHRGRAAEPAEPAGPAEPRPQPGDARRRGRRRAARLRGLQRAQPGRRRLHEHGHAGLPPTTYRGA